MLAILFLLVVVISQVSAKDGYHKDRESRNLESKASGYNAVVAFTAEISEHADLSGGTVMIFDKVITNEGGRYFNTSGQFLCTDDDLYVFLWGFRKSEAAGEEGMRCITKLRKGGSDFKYGPKTDYYSTTNSGSTQMAAALQCSTDVPTAITVMTVPWSQEVGSTALFRALTYTSFTGFRLQSSVAFTVELAEDQSLIDGSRLRFKRVISNFGEHYDPINYSFRCPDDGLYAFTVTAHTPNPSSPWSVSRLMMEGEVVLQGPITYIATQSYDSGTSSMTAVLQCTQNFSVYVEAQASHDFIYNTYGAELTSFTGFKLYDVISGAVAFTAVMTTNQTITADGQPVVFDEVITNIGGAFDSSVSRFVCPDDDFYLFVWSITASDDFHHADLYMNEVRIKGLGIIQPNDGSTSGTCSQSIIKQCQVDSTFQVRAREVKEGSVFLGGFCSFSGYKIPGPW